MDWRPVDERSHSSALGAFYDELLEIRAEMAITNQRLKQAVTTFDEIKADFLFQEVYDAGIQTSTRLEEAWNSFLTEIQDASQKCDEDGRCIKIFGLLGVLNTRPFHIYPSRVTRHIVPSSAVEENEEEDSTQQTGSDISDVTDGTREITPLIEEDTGIIARSPKRATRTIPSNKNPLERSARVVKSKARPAGQVK